MKNTIKYFLSLGFALAVFLLSPVDNKALDMGVSIAVPKASAFVFAKFPEAVYCPTTENFKTDCTGTGEGCTEKDCQKELSQIL